MALFAETESPELLAAFRPLKPNPFGGLDTIADSPSVLGRTLLSSYVLPSLDTMDDSPALLVATL